MLGSVAWPKTGCPSTGCTGAEMRGSGWPASRRGADARSRLRAHDGAASATALSASHRELRVEVEAGLALQAPDASIGCVRAEALRVGRLGSSLGALNGWQALQSGVRTSRGCHVMHSQGGMRPTDPKLGAPCPAELARRRKAEP